MWRAQRADAAGADAAAVDVPLVRPPQSSGPSAMTMREHLKRLTGESAIYGVGQVSGRAVQLILVPVLTRALTPGAYGISELVFAYLQTAVLALVMRQLTGGAYVL